MTNLLEETHSITDSDFRTVAQLGKILLWHGELAYHDADVLLTRANLWQPLALDALFDLGLFNVSGPDHARVISPFTMDKRRFNSRLTRVLPASTVQPGRHNVVARDICLEVSELGVGSTGVRHLQSRTEDRLRAVIAHCPQRNKFKASQLKRKVAIKDVFGKAPSMTYRSVLNLLVGCRVLDAWDDHGQPYTPGSGQPARYSVATNSRREFARRFYRLSAGSFTVMLTYEDASRIFLSPVTDSLFHRYTFVERLPDEVEDAPEQLTLDFTDQPVAVAAKALSGPPVAEPVACIEAPSASGTLVEDFLDVTGVDPANVVRAALPRLGIDARKANLIQHILDA